MGIERPKMMEFSAKKMPTLFVGHGSPMNAIEANVFSANWSRLAGQMPRPEAILAISAHWYTSGSRISDAARPKMIYDMYGFPDELYQVAYDAAGAPEMAHLTRNLISRTVSVDNSWGIDHGTWSVLCHMYPQADIPVYQLSVDSHADAAVHFQIGRELQALREKGVLILGSGNVVHNLARIQWGMDGGLPWAVEFDAYIKDRITERQFEDVIQYRKAGKSSELAFFTPDHFYPLLYVLGASSPDDTLAISSQICTMGSMSMTCYLFQ